MEMYAPYCFTGFAIASNALELVWAHVEINPLTLAEHLDKKSVTSGPIFENSKTYTHFPSKQATLNGVNCLPRSLI